MAAVKFANVAAVALLVAAMAVAATAQEAPAPSPVSPASSVTPSILSAGVAAVAALVFGSALRI
ncbi:hypothetical protein ACJRO7_015730 [Eucalyptus globulus]|uniref:Uncharacterized protein n=1 Tax=Eucalyptus globulus TaxID=34317 RepID=A0ABD3L5P8_EUCGL